MHHPITAQLLTEIVMNERRREADQQRLANRGRARHRGMDHASPARRLGRGPRDTRPRGRVRRRRADRRADGRRP